METFLKILIILLCGDFVLIIRRLLLNASESFQAKKTLYDVITALIATETIYGGDEEEEYET